MLVRRAFYYWQFPAAVVLPVWLLVGWGVFGGSGWGLIGLVLVCPIAFFALLTIALLNYARASVRANRALSWRDVGVLAAWHLSIIGVGFYGSGGAWFAFAAVVLAILTFWYALWALVTDAGRRVAQAFQPGPDADHAADLGPHGSFDRDATVIIVQEKPAQAQHPTAR